MKKPWCPFIILEGEWSVDCVYIAYTMLVYIITWCNFFKLCIDCVYTTESCYLLVFITLQPTLPEESTTSNMQPMGKHKAASLIALSSDSLLYY